MTKKKSKRNEQSEFARSAPFSFATRTPRVIANPERGEAISVKSNKKQQKTTKQTKRAGQGKPALPRVRLERQERQGEALRELKPYGLRELACAVN